MVRSQPRWPQQSRSRLIDGLVDALMTQPHPRLGGEPHPQLTADLLRAPPLVQKLRDHLSEFGVGLNPSPMIAGATRGRATVRIERTVTPTSGGVAAQLARDRRGCPTQPVRNLSEVGDAVRPLRVYVDETHLNCTKGSVELAVAAVALISEPRVLRAPEDLLGLPD